MILTTGSILGLKTVSPPVASAPAGPDSFAQRRVPAAVGNA